MKKLFLAFALLLLAGCSASLELQKQTFTIELGKDIYGNPSLYLKNPEAYNTSVMSVVCLDPSVAKVDNTFVSINQTYLVCGTYDFQLINGSQRADFKIKVKDTQPPNVASSPESITVAKNSTIDWDQIFHASDLSGVNYEAPSNITSAAGTRSVIVKIADKFGNSVEKNITVVIE